MITQEKRAKLETRLLNLWRNGRLFKENPSLVEAFACQAVSLFKPEFDRIAELEAALRDGQSIIADCQAILGRNLPPDGVSDRDTINTLLEILDGSRVRAWRDSVSPAQATGSDGNG